MQRCLAVRQSPYVENKNVWLYTGWHALIDLNICGKDANIYNLPLLSRIVDADPVVYCCETQRAPLLSLRNFARS